jgi:hypothetical protein
LISSNELSRVQSRPCPSIDEGTKSECRFPHPENAILFNPDSDSNVNDESDMQREKQLSPIISNEAGRQIDWMDEQLENAHVPVVISFEFDSNINDESDMQ